MTDKIKQMEHLKELSNYLEKAEVERNWGVVGDVRVDVEEKIREIEGEIREFEEDISNQRR